MDLLDLKFSLFGLIALCLGVYEVGLTSPFYWIQGTVAKQGECVFDWTSVSFTVITDIDFRWSFTVLTSINLSFLEILVIMP